MRDPSGRGRAGRGRSRRWRWWSSSPKGRTAGLELAQRIERHIRETLIVTTAISLVPWATLPRSEYKSKLVDFSEAGA